LNISNGSVVTSIGFMLVVERFLKADVLAMVGR
jgi:hypothetical protein